MDDDAYGRVTAPERYLPLHQAAEDLLRELERRFAVVRDEGDAAAACLDGPVVERAVRLTPANRDSAVLVVGFSAFPGLAVRYGRWHQEHYPSCGCDACDERPDELIETFTQQVEALASGRFSEGLTARTRWHRFQGPDWASSGEGWVPGGTSALGGPQEHHWARWPARAPGR